VREIIAAWRRVAQVHEVVERVEGVVAEHTEAATYQPEPIL
jgi:hypothetical protein